MQFQTSNRAVNWRNYFGLIKVVIYRPAVLRSVCKVQSFDSPISISNPFANEKIVNHIYYLHFDTSHLRFPNEIVRN